ncbi:uncharacterized protein [Rutidosis leptorrhynchoides]|uniref:uncharacterized protein n=1 Tax=Rutidosis leptorrhynchoides TaxID=125765 RepID=UPI003A99583C
MATTAGTVRDAAARRRRIAEKGADRLAFITGRVQSLSSPSIPPSVSPDSDQLPLFDEKTNSPLDAEAVVEDIMSNVQSVNDNSDPITETSTQTTPEPNKLQSIPATLTEQIEPVSASNRLQKPVSLTRRHETFSPNRLRPAIKSSENIRRICSLVVAILVLLSYAGFPILGSNVIKNIVLSRPLFLLILTNITIVVAPLLLEKVKQKEQRRSLAGDAGFANQIGTILEWGLLMKNGLSELFMDCSVYSLVVILGMSLLKFFGLW